VSVRAVLFKEKEEMFFSCLVSENNKYFSNEATKGGGEEKM